MKLPNFSETFYRLTTFLLGLKGVHRIIGDRFTVINPSNFLGSLHYLSPDPIDQGSQRGTDRPQPLQAARSQGEAAEEQFDKGVPDNRGGEAADGHAVPV